MKVKVISLPYIFQVLCFTRTRYQVSVYRTNGPLALVSIYTVGPADSTTDNVYSFDSDTEEEEVEVDPEIVKCRKLFKVST